MSTEFDTRSSKSSLDGSPAAAGPTPGKHSNTELAANGGGGPMPGVPGKRAATEMLSNQEPAGARAAVSQRSSLFAQSFDDARIDVGPEADL